MPMKLISVLLLAAAPVLTAAGVPDDAVFRAMRDELARSMKKLQLENLQKPYFISYRVIDTSTRSVAATFGAVVERNDLRNRLLAVEVRVGDHQRDNTNFYALRAAAGVIRVAIGGGLQVTIDDNYDELRRQLWLATDAAYKQALDDYSRKKAALEHRNRTGDAPDFSKEDAVSDVETAAPAELPANAETAVKTLSALFRGRKGIDNSQVTMDATNGLTRFVSSEGTEYMRLQPLLTVTALAEAQAPDGMPISDTEAVYAASASQLPAPEALAARVRALADRVQKLQRAPLVERYTGPVLFEDAAAAELVAQSLGPAVIAQPRLVVDDTRFEGIFGADEGSLREKLGNRVLPAWMSLLDDPGLKSFSGVPLMGGYQVDEDGVKARRNILVDRGILKGVLFTRALIPGFERSSGNRRAIGPSPSNLILTAQQTLAPSALKAKLIELVKARGLEYGILVRRIGNPVTRTQASRSRTIIRVGGAGSDVQVEPLVEAYKVFPDGREELIRNIGLLGMNVAAFKDVVAASDTPTVYSAPFRNPRPNPLFRGPVFAPSAMASVVTPSLLFEDLTLQRPVGEIPKLPFAPHPSFEK